MKKLKYALLALLPTFTLVVAGCKNPEDQSGSTGSNLTKITSVSDFGKDSLSLRVLYSCSTYTGNDYSTASTYYIYLYLENGKLYSQDYECGEKTYTDTSKAKETYWKKDGELTEVSFTDGKISIGYASTYLMGKVDDTYFIYQAEKFSRISGRGLYSTFEYKEDDKSSKITFKDNGTATSEYSYKDSDGNTQSYSQDFIYKNNNGLISVYGEGTEISGNVCYDGSAIYLVTGIFEEVSELPTATN